MEIKSSADFVKMTRAVLAASGFVRREVGGTVYWASAAPPTTPSPPSAPSPLTRGEGYPIEGGVKLGEGSARENCANTIVMVHGANDQAGTWFTVAPALAQTRHVILIDLPGHGESAPAEGPIPLSLIVERLEAVIDEAAGEEPFTLVGNSLGGWISLLYALKRPERVAQLVLEASGGLARPLSSPLVARTREEAVPVLRAVHGPNYQPPEWVIDALLERANGSPMLRLTEVMEHNVEPRLGAISMPATLIWGADDGVLPLAYGEALQQAIPGASMQVLQGAAHIPHMQQPERYLECLTAIC